MVLRLVSTFLLLGVMVWAVTPDRAYCASANQSYRVAQKYFDQGDYGRAARVLKAILSRQSGHQPSLFLLGRIYYRIGSVNKAVQYFNRAGDQALFADGAFDYGVSFFAVQNCEKALEAFLMIPKNHPQRNLAQFYSGVCLYRRQRYDQAERVLQRAQDLPSKLESAKRDLLITIQRTQASARQRHFSTAPGYAPLPLPSYSAPIEERLPVAGVPKVNVAVKSQPNTSATSEGFSATITPGLQFAQRSYHGEKHQVKFVDGGESGFLANLDGQWRYDFESSGMRPALLLATRADVSNKVAKNVELQYITYEGDSGAPVAQTLNDKNQNIKYLNVYAAPGGSVAFTKAISAEVRYKWNQALADFNQDNRVGFQGPYASLSAAFGFFSASANIGAMSYDSVLVGPTGMDTSMGASLGLGFETIKVSGNFQYVSTDRPELALAGDRLRGYRSRIGADGQIKKQWESWGLALGGSYTTREQPSAEVLIDGNESEIKGIISADKSFTLGATITGSVSMTSLPRNILNVKPPVAGSTTGESVSQVAQGVGTAQGFNVGLKYVPLDWCYMSAGFFWTQYSYTVGEAALVEEFRKAVIDLESGYELIVGFSKSF